METGLVEKVNIERQRYVDYFEKETNFLKKDKENFAIELPIKINDETVSEPFNIVRVDFITKDDNNEYSISELRLEKKLDYDRKRILYGNLEIDLNSFCWNNCEIQADKIEVDSLKDWVTKWLKIDEDIIDGDLSKAIHSCMEPQFSADNVSFIIDFGTATEIALTDLLQLLSDSGATEIIIQTTEI